MKKISSISTEKIFFSQKYLKAFLNNDGKSYMLLRNDLSQSKNFFQYVYSNVYPEIYCATERRGFDLKCTFHIIFKAYKDKKIEHLGKTLKITKMAMTKHVCLNKNQ